MVFPLLAYLEVTLLLIVQPDVGSFAELDDLVHFTSFAYCFVVFDDGWVHGEFELASHFTGGIAFCEGDGVDLNSFDGVRAERFSGGFWAVEFCYLLGYRKG